MWRSTYKVKENDFEVFKALPSSIKTIIVAV